MKHTFFCCFTAAVLLCTGPVFCGETPASKRPVVLTVHGLDARILRCDPGSVRSAEYSFPVSEEHCNADTEACALAAGLPALHSYACYRFSQAIGGMGFGEHSAEYRDGLVLRKYCGDQECSLTAFQWDGDITKSRDYAEELKDVIARVYEEAGGRPFIIIAHSWGSALTFEALKEMEEHGTARQKAVAVDKVVTLGSPLGGLLYKAAVYGLIGAQNFYTSPKRPRSVKKWYNYWAWRDLVSSQLDFADRNIRVDHAQKYREPTDKLYAMSYVRGPGGTPVVAGILEDLDKMVPPLSTMYWHDAYYQDFPLSLPSVGERLEVSIASDFAPDFFIP